MESRDLDFYGEREQRRVQRVRRRREMESRDLDFYGVVRLWVWMDPGFISVL